MIEFACGSGRILRMLNEAGYKCIGIDLSPEMASYTHAHSLFSTDVITADMISAPLKPGSLAAALNTLSSISCLDGMNSVKAHLTDASRLLQSHGFYIIDFLLGVPRKKSEQWQIQQGQDRYEIRWEITGISGKGNKFVEDIEVRKGSKVLRSKSQTTIIPAKDFRTAAHEAGFEVESWFRPFRERPLHDQPIRGRVIAVLRKVA